MFQYEQIALFKTQVTGTPPTTDPDYSHVYNLIGFESGLTDEKTGVAWTAGSSWSPSAGAAKFATYGLPATTTGYLDYSYGSSITLDSSLEFRAEFWINPAAWYAYGTFIDFKWSEAAQRIALLHDPATSGVLRVYVNAGLAITSSTVSTLFDGNYKYCAIYKPSSSTVYYLYMNGALIGTSSAQSNVVIDGVRLGAYAASVAGYHANSMFDEVRVTIGGSRGAPTTVPTAAFPRS